MRANGIVRRIDDLGRIVIPKEIRRTFDVKEGDQMEIFVRDNEVILRKYEPGCTLCGTVDLPLTMLYPGKQVCSGCISAINSIISDVDKLQLEGPYATNPTQTC